MPNGSGLPILEALQQLALDSTTHVSSGGIVGAGTLRSSLNKKTLRDIALAWVVTLPASALLGMVAYGIDRLAFG